MTTAETIRDFLCLPPEALPGAQYLPPWDEDGGDPWEQLRDYLLPEPAQRINHMGETVRLRAARDEWRDGVIVTLG